MVISGRECAKILRSSNAALPGGKMNTIYSKYAKEQFTCVALNLPAIVPCLDYKSHGVLSL
jgi:hypothetical protein